MSFIFILFFSKKESELYLINPLLLLETYEFSKVKKFYKLYKNELQ